jgi:hypothetical protein
VILKKGSTVIIIAVVPNYLSPVVAKRRSRITVLAGLPIVARAHRGHRD